MSPRTNLVDFVLANALPKQHGAIPFAQASAGAERIASCTLFFDVPPDTVRCLVG